MTAKSSATPLPHQAPVSFLFSSSPNPRADDVLLAEEDEAEGYTVATNTSSPSAYTNLPSDPTNQAMKRSAVNSIQLPPRNTWPANLASNSHATGMRFGQKLQGQASHDALVAIQDAEIRLLENIKKCLMLRIKVDREYANGLGEVVATANRHDTSNFKLPVFQAWNVIVKETETQQRLIEEGTKYLYTHTLDRLCHLIADKKDARKFYVDERQRLQVEFHKLQEDPQKQQGEYEKLKEKFNLEKVKYDEVHAKGKPGGKYDDAKARLCKAGMKLHKMHNDYLLSLREVSLHQQYYLNTTLPGLLNYQQEVQETMVNQSKCILDEYIIRTSSSNEKFIACHRQMQKAVTDIDKRIEYTEYMNTHKTEPLEPKTFEFNKNLLNDYRGKLLVNEISLDDLTVQTLKDSRASIAERLQNFRRKKETKEGELKTLEESLTQKPPDTELSDETRRKLDSFRSSRKPLGLGKRKNIFSFEVQEQAMLILRKEISELGCAIDKNAALYELVNNLFEELGSDSLPSGVDLFSTPPEKLKKMLSMSSTLDNVPSESSSSPSSQTSKTLLQKIIPFKRNPRPAPELPGLDIIDRADSDRDNLVVPPGRNSTTDPEPDGYQQEVEDDEMADEVQQCVRDAANHQQQESAQMTLQPDQLEDMELFHGILPRDEVQRLLVNDGDFLVRESKNKKTGQTQFVLSVMWKGHKHFIIQGHQGEWRFEGQQYSTIPELVLHQFKSNQPVTNKSQAILRTPIVREGWELKNDDIEKAEKIDNGHFGEVFRGFYKVNNQEVAIKICRETLSDDSKKKFLLEGRILKQYEHPNIVRFIGIAAQRQPVMIVMEYVSGGSLLKFIQSKWTQLSGKQLIHMCKDAAAGMSYLETKGCIHRDLAARNCLVSQNQVVKISDFGMSREEEVYQVSDGLKQIPIKWTAPEALNLGVYTSMCDVWSYGVLMWEVFSHGDQPYNGLTNSQARAKVEGGYRMPVPEGTPPMVYALILRCWDKEASNRPHFSDIYSELDRLYTVT